MASPSPLASSVEKTNGAKLSRLLIDGGTMVLRKIFDRYHPPANLQSKLNANYGTLNNLLRRRVLHQPQWDLLFPPGGATPDSNTFDITLLFLLLTKICKLSPPPSGWHTKPSASDTSVEANLARIKFFRNELYGHVTTTDMDTPTFSALWQEISAALVALGLPQAEIDRLKAERCGEDDCLDVLFDWADSEEDIKSQLRDIRQHQAKSGQSVFEGKKEDTDQMARIATFGEKVYDDIPDLTFCALDYAMASSSPSPLASSVEKTNGAKLRRLLIDGGTMVLRKIFDRFHPPANLQANLNANYRTLNNLLRRRVLHRRQWDLLFPPKGATADSNRFDITLLFLLLTSICGLSPPPSGRHTKPSASDTSVEANLARIKFFRNELYGHVSTTGMDTPTFSALWQEISAALVALGLPQAEIDRLKAERYGEEDFLDVLFEWAESEVDIKSQLSDIRQAKTGQLVAEGKKEDTDQMARVPYLKQSGSPTMTGLHNLSGERVRAKLRHEIEEKEDAIRTTGKIQSELEEIEVKVQELEKHLTEARGKCDLDKELNNLKSQIASMERTMDLSQPLKKLKKLREEETEVGREPYSKCSTDEI